MKRFTIAILILLPCIAAVAGFPLKINSRSATAPDALAFRSNRMTFDLTFTDGSTASDITGLTPFMNWAVATTSTVYTTSTVSVVVATNGTATAVFSPSDVNYAGGTYMYEAGLYTTNDVPQVYRQGTFRIVGSPTGQGSDITRASNVNWAAYSYSATGASGPYRAGTNISFGTAAADGSVTINSTDGTNEVESVVGGTAIGVSQAGTAWTVAVTDVELTSIAELNSAADRLPFYTGSGTASLAVFTAFARTLMNDANADAARSTLGTCALAGNNNDWTGNVVDFTPDENGTTSFQVNDSGGDVILNVDSENKRVGIGTDAPAAPLEVFASSGNTVKINGGYVDIIRGSGTVRIDGADGGSGGDATISNNGGGGLHLGATGLGTKDVTVHTNGYFGIGTSTPATELDVNGNATMRGTSASISTTNTITFQFYTVSNRWAYVETSTEQPLT